MVGREADLGRLRSLFGASPAPTIALIAGEAGIGKTRLVQELVASAPPGTLVLAGQADPGTVGRPMELFLDALGKTDVSGSPDCAAVVKDPSLSAEERVRAGDRPRALAVGGRARRSSSSRTSTGPTPRASRPSSCSPSPTAARWCSSAPTDPTGSRAATRPPTCSPASTAATSSPTCSSVGSARPR